MKDFMGYFYDSIILMTVLFIYFDFESAILAVIIGILIGVVVVIKNKED